MKNLYYLLSLLLFLGGFSSCSDDEGNYDYDWIPAVGISSFNMATNTYQKGDALVIRPTLVFSRQNEEVTAIEDVFTENDYEYYWIAQRYVKAVDSIVFDTIGRERNLNYIVDLAPDTYLVEYQVRNKTRDITWMSKFTLNITLSAPEGWLLLEDNSGQAELSIYARMGNGSMQMVRNVLASSGIPASFLAGPRQVFGTYQSQKGNGVWILTDRFTGYLDVKSGHKWSNNQVIKTHLVETVGDDFVLNQITGVMYYTIFGFSDDGLRVSRYPAMLFTGDLLPTVDNGRFELAPYVGVIGNEIQTKQVLFFDKTNKKFRILDISGNFVWNDADTKFPSGYDLRFMQIVGESGAQKICCLMEKDGGIYEMVASSSTEVEMEAKLISNVPEFLNAEQTVFHMFLKRPYYVSGNKLYVNLGEALGDREVEFWRAPEEDEVPEEGEIAIRTELEGNITYIKTQMFSDLIQTGNEYRREFMNYVVVATELPDGTGKVYFLTPKSSEAHKLSISDMVSTDHKVISIDYQRPGI